MIEGLNGVMMGVPMHYTPAPPPAASDVSAAKTALQQQLGDNAPENSAALAAAIKKIREENAAVSADALARAAILLQEQYDAAHHQAQDANVDPIKEAESQVGLTHQFDQGTLDAAAKSLTDSSLATAPASTSNTPNAAPSVSLADASTAIQTSLNSGLTWQEAVNAARVQFGGLAQNETVLDEAALTVKGDQLAAGTDARHGDVLDTAAQQLAGLHLFADANNSAALAALKVTFKPSAVLAGDAKTLEQYTALKPQSALSTVSTSSPFDASALAQAQAALEKELGNGAVNAQTLQNALDAAKAAPDKSGNPANANISDTTWAQAALVEQSQADGRANASNKTAPPQDMIAQASGELSGDQLFDANTLDAATRALQGGTLVDGSSTRGSVTAQEGGDPASSPSAAQQMQRERIPRAAAVQYMQNLVSEGMTMPEAIVLTRAWLGGTSGVEPALVRAALTVRSEQPDIMQAYHNDPTQDPIKLAAQQLETLNKTLSGNANDPANLLDPTLIEQIAGKPGAPGMAQDTKPNAGRMLERRLIEPTVGTPGAHDVKPNAELTVRRMPLAYVAERRVRRAVGGAAD